MKHVKPFEQFLNEGYFKGTPRKKKPEGYADEKFWDKAFRNGKIGNPPQVYSPQFRDVLQSIAYDLGLGFGSEGASDTPMPIAMYGTSIKDTDGVETIVKGAFDDQYTYGELKDMVEKWAKKERLI